MPGNITLQALPANIAQQPIANGITYPVAAIAGGVAGGVTFLLLLLGLVVVTILVIHRRSSLQKSYKISELMSELLAKKDGGTIYNLICIFYLFI